MPDVIPREAILDDEPVFWLQADGPSDIPVLYVHGVPTSADDWRAFLQRTGGIAPDLPGFGRSGKRGDGDYSIGRYGPWLERFLAQRGVERFSLVAHGWGAVGLMLAQRQPARLHRLVLIDAVPLLPGHTWHRIARIWRRRLVGELSMGSVNRFNLKLLTRGANATAGPMPDAWLDRVVSHLDQGTQRAILRLHRSADPEVLAAAGQELHTLSCPTLVVWGDQDPYFPPDFAEAYAAAIPCAQILHLPDAGHWPWLDRPDLVDTVAAFLATAHTATAAR